MPSSQHAADAELIIGISDYLEESGRSASWLGYHVLGNPRFVSDLRRGRNVPTKALLLIVQHILRFWQAQLAIDEAAEAEAAADYRFAA